mgnify:FL=1|tara:strand:- start:345 stop:590 length:246 start_codon:yes stop_codon:yes gene_type:complete
MNDVTDISVWRQSKKKLDRQSRFEDFLEDCGLDYEGGSIYELGVHWIVAKDRTDPEFLELREELDREGRDYTVVSEREFDL